MGRFIQYHCPKCGYEFEASFDVGMGFPQEYQETVAKMKAGDYGPQAQEFFARHPEGAVNCERQLYQCTACGRYFDDMSLALYVPKGDGCQPEHDRRGIDQPYSDAGYVDAGQRRCRFKLAHPYRHSCPYCGGRAKVAARTVEQLKKREPLECPVCHARMKSTGEGDWD